MVVLLQTFVSLNKHFLPVPLLPLYNKSPKHVPLSPALYIPPSCPSFLLSLTNCRSELYSVYV